MKLEIDALQILIENACDGCGYSYMAGDCIIDGCAINEAYNALKEFIEERIYDQD